MHISIAVDTPGLRMKENAELLLQFGPQQILMAKKTAETNRRPTTEGLTRENRATLEKGKSPL